MFVVCRQTQWDMPSWDGNAPVLGGNEADMDLGTPTYDEKSKKRTTTAAADTSSELAKRCKLQFRSKVSEFCMFYLEMTFLLHCHSPSFCQPRLGNYGKQ